MLRIYLWTAAIRIASPAKLVMYATAAVIAFCEPEGLCHPEQLMPASTKSEHRHCFRVGNEILPE